MRTDIRVEDFDGPLDLLNYIVEERKADLFDLPIAEITEQYLSVLERSRDRQESMELASEFLLLGATLLQIKTSMMLPEKEKTEEIAENDPREELVLRLMAYRRIKLLARELEEKLPQETQIYLKPPETPARLGLKLEMDEDKASLSKLEEAIRMLGERNALRLGEKNRKMFHFIRRERFSVKAKVKEILYQLRKEVRFFFNELFPSARCSKAERVSAFLAVLELVRENRILAYQKSPFSVILLERETGQPEQAQFLAEEAEKLNE